MPAPLAAPRGARPFAAAAVVAAGLALAPAAVAQNGHSLALTGPPTARPGQTVVVQAAGVVPADVFLNRYLNVYAIPTAVLSACPSTFQNAIQVSYAARSQGGDTVALAVPAAGSFTIPVAVTPSKAGGFLLCGYVHEGVETMSAASLAMTVAAPLVRPRATRAPRLVRAGGRLVCARGAWSGSPRRFTYAWRVAGRTRAGARGRTLAITASVRGRPVRCAVTATNAAGRTTALSPVVRPR